ncbi:hypothetical protein EZS27_041378 [termite gut metagenome]|uniref:DUF4935 domain-containing protein n=1 Tax=termite gut metagenome TaxID=433724 RepID=A0A5J4PBW2_9ZZZZ
MLNAQQVIYNDFYLKGAKIRNLCESAKSTGDIIYIPVVVIDESINQYRERLKAEQTKIAKEISEINKLASKNIDNPLTKEFVSQEIEKYPETFKKRVKCLDIQMLAYPTTPHKELVKRDLARKKPFQESGKGYRDALIWENVKTICKKSPDLFDLPKVIFISSQ